MYVNPIAFGVICTIGVEIAIILVCAAIAAVRSEKK